MYTTLHGVAAVSLLLQLVNMLCTMRERWITPGRKPGEPIPSLRVLSCPCVGSEEDRMCAGIVVAACEHAGIAVAACAHAGFAV